MAAFCILNHGPFLNVPEHWSLYDTDTYADCPLHPEPGWPALLTIDNEHARAEISLFGAHVLRYQRHGEPASLWLSDKAILDGSKPIRGGIPSAGPGSALPARVGSGKPAHGFARNCLWTLDGVSDHGDGTLVHLSCVTTMPAGHSGPMPSSWSWTYWSARSFPWC